MEPVWCSHEVAASTRWPLPPASPTARLQGQLVGQLLHGLKVVWSAELVVCPHAATDWRKGFGSLEETQMSGCWYPPKGHYPGVGQFRGCLPRGSGPLDCLTIGSLACSTWRSMEILHSERRRCHLSTAVGHHLRRHRTPVLRHVADWTYLRRSKGRRWSLLCLGLWDCEGNWP